ncbi:MAG: ABC transporter permease [Clostridium sp.]|nr:ABC transporter permease [Clostridium sp.]MBO6149555.1 ABC transporter permease [Clostridium sp.]
MRDLLEFREHLRAFYEKYSAYVDYAARFMLFFGGFLFLRIYAGYQESLSRIPVILVMSAVCAFLPMGVSVVFAGVVLLAEFYAVSLEVTLVAGMILGIIVLLLAGVRLKSLWCVVLAPVLLALKLPFVLAILVGLSGTVISMVPMSCGILVYYMIQYVRQNSSLFTGGEQTEMTSLLAQVARGFLANPAMIVMMFSCCLLVLVVVIVRGLSVNYAWEAAVFCGIFAGLTIQLAGNIALGLPVSVQSTVISVLLAVLCAVIYRFFVFSVDYTRTEYLQFEDEDYYYYVKAVPKSSIARADVRVQKINRVRRR